MRLQDDKIITLTHSQPVNEITKLRDWMFEKVSPFSVGNILEVASGDGNMSDIFILNEIPVTLSDPDVYYQQILQRKYKANKNVQAILHLDLADEDFTDKYSDLIGLFDTIISLNITEHIPFEKSALANAKKLLKPGGYLIALMPVHFALYHGLDRGFKRWHKSNKQHIQKLLSADFNIIKTKYFNLTGIVRRFISVLTFTPSIITEVQETQYHQLVPAFVVDDLAFKQTGLSVIAIAEKIQ